MGPTWLMTLALLGSMIVATEGGVPKKFTGLEGSFNYMDFTAANDNSVVIQAPAHHFIHVVFTEFRMQQQQCNGRHITKKTECTTVSLDFYNGAKSGSSSNYYCGLDLFNIYSTGNVMTIVLNIRSQQNYGNNRCQNKLQATYAAILKGGVAKVFTTTFYRPSTHIITLDDFKEENGYAVVLKAYGPDPFYVDDDKEYLVTVRFTQFELKQEYCYCTASLTTDIAECPVQYLAVYNGKKAGRVRKGVCNCNRWLRLTSTGDQMTLVLVPVHKPAYDRNLCNRQITATFNYTTKVPVAANGSFNYDTLRNAKDYTLVITAPENHYITVEFTELKLYQKTTLCPALHRIGIGDCPTFYLAVYDGQKEGHLKEGFCHCPSSYFAKASSTGNVMTFVLVIARHNFNLRRHEDVMKLQAKYYFKQKPWY